MAAENQKAIVEGVKGMITVSRAAQVLGVSRRRVLQFIQDGRLKGEQVTPRLWLLDAGDVSRFGREERRPGRKPKAEDRAARGR